jgi:hypothetical protein
MKLFNHYNDSWNDDYSVQVRYIFEFVVIRNRALLQVFYEFPNTIIHSEGGIHILISLFTGCSLFGIDIQNIINTRSLSIYFYSEAR